MGYPVQDYDQAPYGCYAACLEYVLGWPPKSIPAPSREEVSDREKWNTYYNAVENQLRAAGWRSIEFRFEKSADRDYVGLMLAVVPSKTTGFNHCVVFNNDKLEFDPSPESRNFGISYQCDDIMYWTLLVPLEPCRWLRKSG